MRLSAVAKAVPIAAVLGLSSLLILNRGQLHVQATLFSPTQAEQGITILANTDSVILCTGQGTYPVTSGTLSADQTIHFWVYEYTGDEPPNDGAYYASAAQKQIDPSMAQGKILTQMTRGKMYRVNTDQDLHFKCGIGFSKSATASQQNTSDASTSQPSGTTGGDAQQQCTQQECGTPLGMPNSICPDGSIAGPVCERNSNGQCGYVIKQCPASNNNTDTGNTSGTNGGTTGGGTIPQCQTITCSYTLAPGCQYVPGVSQNGCPVCGSVSCNANQSGGTTSGTTGGNGGVFGSTDGGTTGGTTGGFSGTTGGSICTPVDCAAPSQGCRYINPQLDGNGCIIGCGQLVCDQSNGGTTGGSQCQPVDCPAPGDGCEYQNPMYQNGCMTNCGQLVCKQATNDNGNSSSAASDVPVNLTAHVMNEPAYANVRAGNTIGFDVQLTDVQGTTNTAYIGLFPLGHGFGTDNTLTFNAAQSDTRCRPMRTSPDTYGNYDPIYSPYDLRSAAVYCDIGTLSDAQTATVHIAYDVQQDIAPVCNPPGSPLDNGLTTAVSAGSMEAHAQASAQLGPVPTCAQQTSAASSSSAAPVSCDLPSDYLSNAAMYGTRFDRQHTSDNSLFVYTVKVNNPQGDTSDVYTRDLKVFDKTTCQEKTLATTYGCTAWGGYPGTSPCVTYKTNLNAGYEEPSVSDDGKIVENAYQLDSINEQRIYHTLSILDKNGNKIATIAQQIPVGALQLNGSSWPLTRYSNTDAQISRDGSKVVFEAFTPSGSLDTASGQSWTLPYGNQVYVWQNGKITQITRYNGNPNMSQNHPWNWDARFEDTAGRFISINLGYDPQTGQMFPPYQPLGPGSFWTPVYKLYLYDSQSQVFYKISDDMNPQSREQYQSQINNQIVSLGGTVSNPSPSGSDNGQTQPPLPSQQPANNPAPTRSDSLSCAVDSDCPATQCSPCNSSMQSCSVCLSYTCQAGVCTKKITTTF
ncbi:MAG TPA: hypothetical protein VHA78_05670 [Candidatus Peribacteraceae bacterium]|nr:hypothetical protein [Candidatus Peribacteraceae bacterium]